MLKSYEFLYEYEYFYNINYSYFFYVNEYVLKLNQFEGDTKSFRVVLFYVFFILMLQSYKNFYMNMNN